MKYIPIDKLLHFLVGFTIAVIITTFSNPMYGLLYGAIAALGKELYDEYSYKGFDVYDLLMTLIGTIFGVLLLTYKL